jgi:poly(3-hydroxybutyrate) depolymerase
MKKLVLPAIVFGFIASSMSCSNNDGTSNATGGTQGSATGGGPGSGGTPTSGGASGVGGVAATGGSAGAQSETGGAVGTGGRMGSGGMATGGQPGTGGTASGTGGTAQSGTSATGGSIPPDGGPDVARGTGGTGTGGATAPIGTGGVASGGAGGGTAGTGGGGAAVPSPGCGKTPTLTSGSRTIQSASQSRNFILRIPSGYDNSHPYRLIFAFHWNGGTMTDIDGGGTSGAVWSYYGLQAQADNSTIFVAPQGISNGWANSGGRDLTFVDDMVKLIEEDLCVDTSRVFSVGFSYGGGMSYELACARPKVFRAVTVYSGAQLSGCDGGKDPIAYLGIHGVSDGTCNISGGRSLRDTFVKNNGCTAQSPPEPAAGSGKHTCTTYTGCKAGYPVEWCAFDGGHTPGNVDGGGDDGAKTWTKGEVWKFFSQF